MFRKNDGQNIQNVDDDVALYCSDAPPATSPLTSRPVSGLASLDLPPSHDLSQWRIGKSALAYRCGGSSGIEN
jgi:hypothetical protein